MNSLANKLSALLVSVFLALGILAGLAVLLQHAAAVHAGLDPVPPARLVDEFGFSGTSTSDDLIVFNKTAGTALSPTVDLMPEGDYPYDATLNRGGDEVWVVGASGEGGLVISATGHTILHRLPALGDYPVDIAFSKNGEYAYVSNRNTADDIKVIDTSTYTVVDTIAVPDQFLGTGKMRTNHCTGELYAVNWFDDRFFVIDPDTQSVTSDLTFGDSLWDLAIDPLATTLYIADRGLHEVHIFDLDTLTVTGSIPVGQDPWGIDITPDGDYVLVANEDSHDVSVIDTGAGITLTTIALASDADPRDVDIDAAGEYAYVTSGAIAGADAIYVIDLDTFQIVDTIFSPSASEGVNPNVVAVAPDFASLDPTAAFTVSGSLYADRPIQFTDASGNVPDSWEWDFGDGSATSSAQNPSHTYDSGGVYTVTLTVSNQCGMDSAQQVVEILSPPSLRIEKSAPAEVGEGAPITYTLSIENMGPGLAENLVITDVLPAGASYVSGGVLSGGVVTWQPGDLGASSSLDVQFVVTAIETITNSSYMVSADGDYQATGTEDIVTVVADEPVIYLPFLTDA